MKKTYHYEKNGLTHHQYFIMTTNILERIAFYIPQQYVPITPHNIVLSLNMTMIYRPRDFHSFYHSTVISCCQASCEINTTHTSTPLTVEGKHNLGLLGVLKLAYAMLLPTLVLLINRAASQYNLILDSSQIGSKKIAISGYYKGDGSGCK